MPNSYICSNLHSFDIAREGYVNLLMSNYKASKLIGDTKEMVIARSEFLNKGFYDNISETITDSIIKKLKDNTLRILDAGCGEGYYTNQIHHQLKDSELNLTFFGFDLSKDAIRFAAKKYKEIDFIVANTYNKITFVDNSIDIIINWKEQFELISNISLTKIELLDINDIKNLIRMTPLNTKMTDDLWNKVNLIKRRSITFSFNILYMKRR